MRTLTLLQAAAVALPALAACGDRRPPAPPAQPPAAAAAPAPAPTPPPAPPALAVGPHRLWFDALGDTAQLRVPAGAACVSLDTTVATIDSTGLVRSRGNGGTVIRCRRDDASGLVRVAVAQRPARARILARAGALARAGDSVALGFGAIDRLGSPVSDVPAPIWISLDTTVATVDALSGLARSRADSGSARIVAAADGLTDTITLDVGVSYRAGLSLGITNRPGRVSRAAFVRSTARRQPPRSPAAAAAAGVAPGTIGARAATATDSLDARTLTAASAPRGLVIEPHAVLFLAEHRVNPGTGIEATSGLMYGVGLEVRRGWLRLGAQLATGSLTSDDPGVRSRSVTDLTIDAGILALPWLTLAASGGLRVYTQDAQENWRFLGVSGIIRFPLGNDALSGELRLTLLPIVSRTTPVAGAAEPTFGVTGASGLHFQRRALSGDIQYFMERYIFAAKSGVTRLEQFSGVRLRLGVAF